MQTPLVSIIVTVYNKEKYLGELLDSILDQTYSRWEVILIDDCSQDSSWKIAQEYQKKHSEKVFCYRNAQNLGLNLTTYEGYKRSRGQRIMLADADDVWLSNRLELQMNKTLQHGSDLSYCDMVVVDENLNVIYSSLFKRLYNSGNRLYDNSFRKIVREGNHAPATMLFKKELDTLFFPISRHYGHQDQRFILKALHHKKSILRIYDQLVFYRQHPTSLLAQNKKNKSQANISTIKYRKDFLRYTPSLSGGEVNIIQSKIQSIMDGITLYKFIIFIQKKLYLLSHKLLGIPSFPR